MPRPEIISIIAVLRDIQVESHREYKSKIAIGQMTRDEANHRYVCLDYAIDHLRRLDARKGSQTDIFSQLNNSNS